MSQEDILKGLYDNTLIGNAPEVKDLTNQGLEEGVDPEVMLYEALIPSLEEVGARSTAFTHTQRISGLTSQCPFGRTPPHGPLRRVLGQFIGHVMPVECRTHWPHI